jgi:hypothetical protein
MQACISIFKRIPVLLLLLSGPVLFAPEALAQGGPPSPEGTSPAAPAPAKKEEIGLFDGSSPYLEYGDFNMNEEENEDTQFFQYGRFFALSLGLGYQSATGNRGKLYTSALPRFDARIQYWFGFNLAGDLGVFFANHSYTKDSKNTDVKMIGYGFHLKYYFDVKNASASLTFANPFLMAGIGAMSKSETSLTSTQPGSDSTMSVDFGGGLEFPVASKRTYLTVEGLYHTQSFADVQDTDLLPDNSPLTGGFFSLMVHFMFVW